MRWLKPLSIAILLSLLLIVALLALLPNLLLTPVEKALPLLMKSSGLSSPQIKVKRLSWRHIQVDSASFNLKNGTHISAQNLAWVFSPFDLMNSNVGRIELQTLSINLPKAKATQQALQGSTQTTSISPKIQAVGKPLLTFNDFESVDYQLPKLKTLLPIKIEQLNINEIQIQHSDIKAQLSFLMKAEQINVEGNINAQDSKALQVKASLENFEHFKAKLFNQAQTYLQLQADIEQTQTSTRISFNQQLNSWPKALPDDFKILPKLIKQQSLKGSIQLSNQGKLPEDASFELQAQLVSKQTHLAPSFKWFGGKTHLNLSKQELASNIKLSLIQTPAKATLYLAESAKFKSLQLESLNTNAPLIQAQCDSNFSQCTLRMNTNLKLSSSNQLNARIDLTPKLVWKKDSPIQITAPLQVKADIKMPDVPVKKSQLTTQVLAQISPDGQWQISIPKGLKQTIHTTALNDWHLERTLTLDWFDKWQATGKIGSSLKTQFKPLTLSIKTNALKHKESNSRIQLRTTKLTCQQQGLSLSLETLQINCGLNSGAYRSNYKQWPIPEFLINSQFIYTHANQKVRSSGKLVGVNDKLKLDYKWFHQVKNEQGDVQFHIDDMPLNFTTLKLEKLSQLSKLNLLNGYLNAQGWLKYHKENKRWQTNPDVMLTINQLAGTYDNSVAFDDWNLNLNIHRPELKDYEIDANLRGKSVDSGVKAEQILASSKLILSSDLKHYNANVHQINAQIFNGRIYTPPFVYSSKKEVNTFSAMAEGLSIKEISKLSKAGDVDATGTLDGEIPVTIINNKPQVSKALLQARPPGGIVKVKPETTAPLKKSHAAVGFAMNALENFHYKTLDVTASYAPDGRVDMGLGFKGSNPDFFDGQSTHMNINFDYNLHDLLESLRITNRLIEGIEEKYAP